MLRGHNNLSNPNQQEQPGAFLLLGSYNTQSYMGNASTTYSLREPEW